MLYEAEQVEEKADGCSACLHAEDSLYVPSEDWDSNPRILNTPMGIVDLTTGEMHERTPHDCVTKVTERSPVEGPTPKFDQFMNDIFSEEHWGDDAEEVREFVLNFLALSLWRADEQLFFSSTGAEQTVSQYDDLVRNSWRLRADARPRLLRRQC